MIMITAQAFETFESLWRRRGTYHEDLSYGQALAKFTKCEISDPDSDFLATASYPAVKQWVQEQVDANSKIQAKGDPS
jgi:hypothetical protein